VTEDNRDENDASQTASTRLISVVDAVCCVYFCAAGKSSLLVRILVELGMEILIPAEVEREVLSKRQGQVQDHWPRLRSSSRVRILEELTLIDSRADVVAAVARVRGASAHLALSTRRDLGEAVVIGHATVLAAEGHDVYVVIDDQGGQTLATNEGLTVLTVEDLLMAAVQLGLVGSDRLRRTYEDLIPFGSGLPTWQASTLKKKYTEWRRSQT
jgi:predicted nucleic acid-binding protein